MTGSLALGHRLQLVGPEAGSSGGIKPPHSLEAEREILAACFISGVEAAREVVSRCKGRDFYFERHQHIFTAVSSLIIDRPDIKDIDLMLVRQEMVAQGTWEKAGGARALGEVLERMGICSNLSHYIEILLDYSVRRDIADVARLTETRAYDETTDVRQILEESERNTRRIRESRSVFVDTHDARGLVSGLCDRFVKPVDPKRLRRISGMRAFDFGQGYKPGFGDLSAGCLYVIQGKPSHGKTAFALNNFGYNILKAGGRVYFWSRDMSAERLMMRLVGTDSGVPFFVQERGAPWDDNGNVRENAMSPEDWDRLMVSLDRTANFKFHCDDQSRSVEAAWERARAVKRESGPIDLFIMDYVQLVRSPPGRRLEGEPLLTDACQSLKEWTTPNYLDCPGLMLSQPDKASRKVDAPEQTLSDAKGAGTIEEVAEAGWVVEQLKSGERQIRVVKDRNYGLNGTVYGAGLIRYDGARMRFVDA